MKKVNINKSGGFIETLTAKWWFLALVPIIFFFSPPYVQRNGYPLSDFSKWYATIGEIGSKNFTSYFAKYSIIMNLIAIAVIILAFVLKNKFSSLFSIYIAIMMAFYGITQNTSYTEENGLGIVTSSYIVLPLLSGVWIWEAFVRKNDFSKPKKLNIWTIGAFLLALFAFWNPIDSATLMPDFNPAYLLTNGSNSMFCTMTPMIIAVMFFIYPNINTAVLRVTGITGATIGFIQILLHLVLMGKTNWWIGVIHIPVFLLSIIAVIVSFKADKIKNK
ncbi:MAG TPA: hypothetical protein PLA01_00065 [Acetivibrio sp.]|nr:hypothetical protein [Acetivibrio sp.]